jgi:uncharacterized protein YbjT (DUF2867 family)
MNVILGATGQIGALLIEELHKENLPVKGVVRNPDKAKDMDCETTVADFFDLKALKNAFQGGGTIFLLTPENPASKDIVADVEKMLSNFKEAINASGAKRIVGLSSIGAQHPSGTGNLRMSYLLEHAFEELQVEQIFVRPAYYYSNWLAYMDAVKEQGILPTFFPLNHKIPMIAPTDVARFVSGIIRNTIPAEKINEIVGPSSYSSFEVAAIFGKVFNKKVEAQQIPREDWSSILNQSGFSDHAAHNLIEMTDAVINGTATPENKGRGVIQLQTSLEDYLLQMIQQ